MESSQTLTICMLLIVVVGVVIFLLTHLDKGTIAKYSKNDSENVINGFITSLQNGDTASLDYVWYHKDSSKMLKELEDYNNKDVSTAVTDEQDAYKGLKILLADKQGREIIKKVFKETPDKVVGLSKMSDSEPEKAVEYLTLLFSKNLFCDKMKQYSVFDNSILNEIMDMREHLSAFDKERLEAREEGREEVRKLCRKLGIKEGREEGRQEQD